jgi:two-component system response regulator FixJ
MTQDVSSHVAIVDDDAAVLDALRLLLELVGYRVAAFASAATLLAASLPRPACVILDQHMPWMTGLELADHLRRHWPGIVIMLMTADMSAVTASRARALGIENVWQKPVPEADLLRFVGQHAGPARPTMA